MNRGDDKSKPDDPRWTILGAVFLLALAVLIFWHAIAGIKRGEIWGYYISEHAVFYFRHYRLQDDAVSFWMEVGFESIVGLILCRYSVGPLIGALRRLRR